MWPILALILLFPKTPNQILYGNTDMWVAAAIAGGVRWAGVRARDVQAVAQRSSP
jgi:hypothetical protein